MLLLILIELVSAYECRAYHNLHHISALYTHLYRIKELIDDFDVIFYAICYHDIIYDEYVCAIREEYGAYSDRVFGEGRERVVEYFLSQQRIYHTTHFYNLYQEKAVSNLNREKSLNRV